MRACCFTGHRPEKCDFAYNGASAPYVLLSDELESSLKRAIDEGFTVFYSGGARGFDLLAAEKLIELKKEYRLKLIMAIPFRGQENAYSAEWKARYRRVLSGADEIIYLSSEYHRGCYENRNRYMVDQSERVIAHYDGSAGGTRNTVNYAKKQGKEVINLGERLKNIFNYSIFEEDENNGK